MRWDYAVWVKPHRSHSWPEEVGHKRKLGVFVSLHVFGFRCQSEKWHNDDRLQWWESESIVSLTHPGVTQSNARNYADTFIVSRKVQHISKYVRHARFICVFALCMCLCVQGAFWGLMVGLVVGVCRMVLEFAFPPPRCGISDSAPDVLRRVHYLHFAILLCGLTVVVVTTVSLLTPPPTHEQVCTRSAQIW